MLDNLTEWKILYDKGFIDDDEFINSPFNATVVRRLKSDPEYKDELINETVRLIQVGELKTAHLLLKTVIDVVGDDN